MYTLLGFDLTFNVLFAIFITLLGPWGCDNEIIVTFVGHSPGMKLGTTFVLGELYLLSALTSDGTTVISHQMAANRFGRKN